eukprot:12372346-Alexandrium_andersonii.AAC.1
MCSSAAGTAPGVVRVAAAGTLNPFGGRKRRPTSIDHKARCTALRHVSLWRSCTGPAWPVLTS